MSDKKPFSELLSEAPVVHDAEVLSLVGVLGRSARPDKFVLTASTGESITLDVGAIKGYAVLVEEAGQTIVKVDLDPRHVPPDVHESDPWARFRHIPTPTPWAVPFVLGPHHVSAGVLAAFLEPSPAGLLHKLPIWDSKRPFEDGTFGRHRDF